MWIDRINELVPSGLLRVRENAGAFYRLGMPKWRALSKAFDAKAAWEMNWARLPCYPPGFLDSLRYVVDIGANDGGWSRAFLKFTKPEKWLVVEPNPEMLEVATTFEDAGMTRRMMEGAADMFEMLAKSPLAKETPEESKERGRSGKEIVQALAAGKA